MVFDDLDFIVVMFGLIGLEISSWKVSRAVRKRMSKTMGRKPSDLEMASLKTWMEVEQAEELNQAVKRTHPE
jgi:hypothetical protein